MINSSGFVPFHNCSEFLMKASQFIFHNMGFLSFIKLLLRLSKLSIILIFNNLLRNLLWIYNYSLVFFYVASIWLIIKIDAHSLYSSFRFHRFWDNFVLLLWNHLSLLLVSDSTLISINFVGIAITRFPAIKILSQFSIVKTAFHSKLNHLTLRIFNVLIL